MCEDFISPWSLDKSEVTKDDNILRIFLQAWKFQGVACKCCEGEITKHFINNLNLFPT
jgi:hypothetical protein